MHSLGVIDETSPRQEWDAYDLLYGGAKIEVKASGRSQSWPTERPSVVSFRIEPKKSSWEAETNTEIVHEQPRRIADVYVFCVHESENATNESVADPGCWRFWVINSEILDRELGAQKTVRISSISRLAAPVTWPDIRAAIDHCLEQQRSARCTERTTAASTSASTALPAGRTHSPTASQPTPVPRSSGVASATSGAE